MKLTMIALTAARLTGAGTGVAADASVQRCLAWTVAKDGRGDFTSVQAAIDAVPDGTPAMIRIRRGVHHEVVRVPATKPHLTLFGTTGSATVTLQASDFTARHITFSNSFDRAAHPEITATRPSR